jgi:hypothetical protein
VCGVRGVQARAGRRIMDADPDNIRSTDRDIVIIVIQTQRRLTGAFHQQRPHAPMRLACRSICAMYLHMTVKGKLEPDLASIISVSCSQYIPKISSISVPKSTGFPSVIPHRAQRCLRILTTYDRIEWCVLETGAGHGRRPTNHTPHWRKYPSMGSLDSNHGDHNHRFHCICLK